MSYAQFLYPTNALVRQKSSGVPESCTAQTPQSRFRGNGPKSLSLARLNSSVPQDPRMSPNVNTYTSFWTLLRLLSVPDAEEAADYDPNLLSDPQWPCGRHKRVLIFASYVVRRTVTLMVGQPDCLYGNFKCSNIQQGLHQQFRLQRAEQTSLQVFGVNYVLVMV